MHFKSSFLTLSAVAAATFCVTVQSAPPVKPAPAPAPLVVVDSVGKTVGRLSAVSGAGVYVTVNNVLAFAGLIPYTSNPPAPASGAQLDWGGGALYFATTDCTGTPYIGGGAPTGAAHAVVLYAGGVPYLYLAPASAPSLQVAIQSYFNGGCFSTSGTYGGLLPAQAPIDARTLGVAPFTVQ